MTDDMTTKHSTRYDPMLIAFGLCQAHNETYLMPAFARQLDATTEATTRTHTKLMRNIAACVKAFGATHYSASHGSRMWGGVVGVKSESRVDAKWAREAIDATRQSSKDFRATLKPDKASSIIHSLDECDYILDDIAAQLSAI